MSIFREPEIPARVGTLHDEAFDDGDEPGAEIERELIRPANVLTCREHLVYRYVARASSPTDGAPGFGLGVAPPFWSLAVPMPPDGLPVEKKWGLSRLRMFVRASVETGRVVELFLATTLAESPDAAPATLTLLGTGALALYEVDGIPCRKGAGERISIYQRALIDIDNDPLLDTGTYGGVDRGTIDSAPTLYSMRDVGAGWNATGNTMDRGGHYLVTRDSSGAARLQGAEIRAVGPNAGGGATDELIFWPPASDQRHLIGADYEIRKLPQQRIVSIAIYAQDREGP